MERNYKDDGSSTRMNRLEITRMDHMRYINRSTTTMNKYPQVEKTGVNAVHGSCQQTVYITKEMLFVICMCNDD
jgi:tetrahydromethanopterin S-methyltransferase subunit B